MEKVLNEKNEDKIEKNASIAKTALTIGKLQWQ